MAFVEDIAEKDSFYFFVFIVMMLALVVSLHQSDTQKVTFDFPTVQEMSEQGWPETAKMISGVCSGDVECLKDGLWLFAQALVEIEERPKVMAIHMDIMQEVINKLSDQVGLEGQKRTRWCFAWEKC